MKSFRKMLLFLLVLLLIPMMAACGEDDDNDDDDDKKESAEFTIERGENTPKGVVESALQYSDSLEKSMEEVSSTFLMFSNEKALKKLDMDKGDDDEVSFEWEVTESVEYDKDSDLTAGVKAYVRMMAGDSSAIEQTALVEVEGTITAEGRETTMKTYYTLARIGGTWYLASDDSMNKNSFDEVVEYWRGKVGR